MKNIVVGVDGSEASMKAVSVVAGLAAASKSRVVLAHVLPVPMPLPPEAIIPPGWIEELTSEGQRLLRLAAAICTAAQVEWEARIVDGVPEQALLALAAELGSELVAVGSRGRGQVSRLLLGSVADRLVQTANRPVLVAR